MRIGLLADTHIPEAGPDLAPEVYDAFAGCDRILHCGDLHALEVLDRLERVAPVVASRGNGDTLLPAGRRPGVPDDPRVAETFVFEVDGITIGLTHDLEDAEHRDDEIAAGLIAARMGARVDIAVCGHTHVPMVWGLATGTTIVNPGSPTMPYGYLGIVGTVGFIDIEDGRFEITVVDLASGETQLALAGPGPSPCRRGPRPSVGRVLG